MSASLKRYIQHCVQLSSSRGQRRRVSTLAMLATSAAMIHGCGLSGSGNAGTSSAGTAGAAAGSGGVAGGPSRGGTGNRSGAGGRQEVTTGGTVELGGSSGAVITAGAAGSEAGAGSAGELVTGGAAGVAARAGAAGQSAEAGSSGTAGAPGAAGSAGVAGAAGAAGAGGFGGRAGAAGAGGVGGAAGFAGAAGAGGDEIVAGPEGPSCSGMSGTECGGISCCSSVVLPGGTFWMGRGSETCTSCSDGCPPGHSCDADEQPEHEASPGRFALDKFEVTVGRFRQFVAAGAGTRQNPPAAGRGAHPAIAGSGWDSAWDTQLPVDSATLRLTLRCSASDQTWTDEPGANEAYPINCVSWYEAMAFCIWDSGRLPTEAEWEYAAAGGDSNRVYPWGNDVSEPLPANYLDNHNTPLLAVGSEPAGNGRWGHSDLAGGLTEWVLDWYLSTYYSITQSGCAQCANLTPVSYRAARGGNWASDSAAELRAANRDYYYPGGYLYNLYGFRCVRSAS